MISKLKSTPLQPAYFQVKITAPHLTGLIASDSISLYCIRAQLPGISFQASTVRQSGLGNEERRPTAVDFQDLQLAFVADGEGEMVKFFHRWMQSIYKFDDRNGLNSSMRNGLKTYMFEYPQNYEANIQITQYQVDEKPVVVYNLFRAYPHSVGALNSDWSTQNDYHQLAVNFYYKSWSSNLLESGTSYDVVDTYLPPELDISTSGLESVDRAVTQFFNPNAKRGGLGVLISQRPDDVNNNQNP
jgi:hypothetical protein